MADSTFPVPHLLQMKSNNSVQGSDARYAEGNGDSWVPFLPLKSLQKQRPRSRSPRESRRRSR
jgi:hypothetical protein